MMKYLIHGIPGTLKGHIRILKGHFRHFTIMQRRTANRSFFQADSGFNSIVYWGDVQCSRCDNTDPRYFYRGTRGLYCRRCIKFGDVKLPEISSKIVDSEYQLKFELTERQKEVSARLTEMVSQGRSVLLEAVCGAGKTEIIFEMVSDQLKASMYHLHNPKE